MRALPLRSLVTAVTAVLALIPAACSELPPPAHAERAARAIAPPPACVRGLRASEARDGVRRGQLAERDIWAAVIPGFDVEHATLPTAGKACNGLRLDARGDASDRPRHPDHPQSVVEGDVRLVAGGDHLQLAWLRTRAGDDATSSGPVALLRDDGDVVEVYGVGVLRARDDDRLALSIERVGGRLAVAVTEDGCAGRKPGADCASSVRILLLADGQLAPAATIDTERVASVTAAERGSAGRIEYHLTTSHLFTARGVKLFEQLLVSDDQRHPLRTAERERELVLSAAAPATENAPSLWSTIGPTGTPTSADPTTSLRPTASSR